MYKIKTTDITGTFDSSQVYTFQFFHFKDFINVYSDVHV